MRPVKRSDIAKSYRDYKSYLKPLIKNFGPYCSYCEAQEKLDVEHVVPKSKAEDLELEWSNLLLGCARCNRDFKKAWNNDRNNYLWPDTNDTFHAFVYEDTGRALVNPALDSAAQAAAKNIRELVKLDDGSRDQPVLNTRRRARFGMARTMKELYLDGALDLEGLMGVVYSAPSWSVWMTVFADAPEVKERLLNDDHFPNTAVDYFS